MILIGLKADLSIKSIDNRIPPLGKYLSLIIQPLKNSVTLNRFLSN